MKEASPTLVPGTVVTETTSPAETAAGALLAKTSSFTVGEIRVKVEDAMERYPWMSQQSLEKLYDLVVKVRARRKPKTLRGLLEALIKAVLGDKCPYFYFLSVPIPLL